MVDITHLDDPIFISMQIISMPSQFDSYDDVGYFHE